MNESRAIGIRVDKDWIEKIEELSKEENLDRSSAMRLLLKEGYENLMKKKAMQEYKSGKITISKAAEKANCTIWEIEQYMIQKGFRSQYSIEDLKEETRKQHKK